MNLLEAEQRLAAETSYLDTATHAGNPVAIALAQAHVRYWESVVRQARLEDQGGWRP